MKKYYISDVLSRTDERNCEVELYGWVYQHTVHKNIEFVGLEDSTGRISLLVPPESHDFVIRNEQSVYCKGKLDLDKLGKLIVVVDELTLIGDVNHRISPPARADSDVFAERNANNVVQNKHLYIRNIRFREILKARDLVIEAVRCWFKNNGYYDVTAPILTPVLLYDKSTGINVSIKNQNVFLTQCVGFYLESAVHSLEKVYNIGPSFRGAESVTKRHLMEYWHVKSELAFCSFQEYFDVVEDLIKFVTEYVWVHGGEELAASIGTEFCGEGKNIPFPRIEYTDALELLNRNGFSLAYGRSLNGAAEKFLSEYFGGAIWVVHKPKSIEGFPYKFCENSDELTMTADLISSNGMGEILGIAEKITDVNELKQRINEKGKSYEEYKWFCELREYGTVPHCGLGMGLERLIRWLFCMNHVKDVIPFPRRINKTIYP